MASASSLGREYLSGSLASCTTAALFSPLECVKTRLQLQDMPGWRRIYTRGFLHALQQIYRQDGLLATGMRAGEPPRWGSSLACAADAARQEGVVQGLMVRGASASISRAALLTAAQLSSYDHAKVHLRPALGDGTLLHVAAAVISGFVATAACNPADVVKSRVMSARGGGGGATGAGMVVEVWRREGVRGFYRGFLPAYARIGPTIFIQMPLAEVLRSALGVQGL